jgi:hypothetical protein
MQFGLTHSPLHAEEKSVIELAGIVEAVFIKDECFGQSTDFQESVPIGVVAREAGYLQSHDNAGFAHACFSHKPLKAPSIFCRCA